MKLQDISLPVEFTFSRQRTDASLRVLVKNAIDFLESFGEESVVGKKFYSIIKAGGGRTRFNRLLKAAKFENDPEGFFSSILGHLESANNYTSHPVEVNKIELPYLFLLSILEILIPGDSYHTIKKVEKLEKLTNIKVPDEERKDLQKVIETYPVRLSDHVIRQMRLSNPVAYQFMPFVDELNKEGLVQTWVGQFHRGIVEQMYQNRPIFVLNMACPVYCRFCFRKHKECRNQKTPTQPHVKEAVRYIKDSQFIKEVVLTGGDPFMNRATVTLAIDGLKDVPHVQTVRIASRSISYYPHMFYRDESYWINYLKRKNIELKEKGKRIEVATHFIHPDEISIESLDIITELVSSGIAVYVQTPFLSGCNDEGPELVELYRKLRGAGAEMHYLYIPCSSIQGNRRYVSPLSSGFRMSNFLRAHLSDRALPRTTTATSIGKIDWGTTGWVVEKDKESPEYIWIRTPYTKEFYEPFTPILHLTGKARINSEGTLDAKFMANIGDDSFLVGERKPRTSETFYPPTKNITEDTNDNIQEAILNLRNRSLGDQRNTQSIVNTGFKGLYRIHKTRVEMDIDTDMQDIKNKLSYLKHNSHITDIILSSKGDIVDSIYRVTEVIQLLRSIKHINSIRLRSLKFNYEPELYTYPVVSKLSSLNKLSIVDPQRLEIETQFLHGSEFKPEHKKLAKLLRSKGITVYNNTPLLTYINDSPESLHAIAYKCREMDIEFHHCYISGLPLQLYWNAQYPINETDIIDIATHVRMNGSGRELPRYIYRTILGEVDYGLTSQLISTDDTGRILLKLLPYDLSYFREMDTEFVVPKGVRTADDGKFIVKIDGVRIVPDFLV
ncbi:radical SAM protein [candidate division KSB1 bacterium]